MRLILSLGRLTFIELLLLVFGMVNVDVSSGFLRSDNALVLKGSTLSA
jgi:hypothetical protein